MWQLRRCLVRGPDRHSTYDKRSVTGKVITENAAALDNSSDNIDDAVNKPGQSSQSGHSKGTTNDG